MLSSETSANPTRICAKLNDNAGLDQFLSKFLLNINSTTRAVVSVVPAPWCRFLDLLSCTIKGIVCPGWTFPFKDQDAAS